MHWILQENLINPTVRDELATLLAKSRTPFTMARLVPVFNQLDQEIAEPEGPVFVYGSTGLGEVAKARGWAPGYYDDNLDYAKMLANFGRQAVNYEAVCMPLGEVTRALEAKMGDTFFLRPVLDTKSFAGCTMTWEDLSAFQAGIARVEKDRDVSLRLADMVVVAPLKEIYTEYRFFVIGGRVVTGCRYKHQGLVRPTAVVPNNVVEFAKRCVAHWSPNKAYTLDIADTDYGLKVLEMNSANSAGFYACDIGLIVEAVNTLLH